jgi:hypothetical protein
MNIARIEVTQGNKLAVDPVFRTEKQYRKQRLATFLIINGNFLTKKQYSLYHNSGTRIRQVPYLRNKMHRKFREALVSLLHERIGEIRSFRNYATDIVPGSGLISRGLQDRQRRFQVSMLQDKNFRLLPGAPFYRASTTLAVCSTCAPLTISAR